MENYILTVIIDCTNHDKMHIEKTIQSISCSENVEVILCNTTLTADQFSYTTKIINKSSLIESLECAKKEALGKYIHFLSAGDYYYKNSLKRMMEFLLLEKHSLLHCSLMDHHHLYQIEKSYNDSKKISYKAEECNRLPIKLKGCFFKKDWIHQASFDKDGDNSFELAFLSAILHKDILCYKLTNCVVSYFDNTDLIPFENKKELSQYLLSFYKKETLTQFEEYFILNELKKYLTKSSIKYHGEHLDKQEKETFIKDMRNILLMLSDESIIKMSSIIIPYKYYLLSLKYGENFSQSIKLTHVQDNKKEIPYVAFKDKPLFDLTSVNNFKIHILESKNNILLIDGVHVFSFLHKNFQLVAIDDKKNIYKPQLYKWTLSDKEGFVGEKAYYGCRFQFSIPLNQVKHIYFAFLDHDNQEYVLIPSFGKFSKLVKKYKMSYYAKDNYIFRYRKKGISISKKTWKSHLKAELKFMMQLLKRKKMNMVWMRLSYYFVHFLHKKPIWLIRDNEKRAKDSGAEMFKYCSQKKEVSSYFILDKKSSDYAVLKNYGPIIQPDSFRYKLYHLLADKLIDTRGGINAQYVFKDDYDCVMDLCDWDYIWLIHGIMTRNESTWTNKYTLNAKLFATCNEREYHSVLDEDNGYGYDETEVALTGLPRHDALYANKKKKILFLPTWRKHLAGDLIPGTSDRSYVENFKETDYFQFYNSLINDERLLNAMKEKGYTGDFYLHPSFMKQCHDFEENDFIYVGKEAADTNQLIGECSLLITDYSSAQFEGAYLDTPVIYPQYDDDTFSDNHTGKEGYFDYVKDGFGPVCYNLDDTVQAIIDYIYSDCENKEPYRTRAKEFFAYRDHHNSERVYECIMNGCQSHDDKIHIDEDEEKVYLYQGDILKNAVLKEDIYKLYNPLFHLTSYVKKIVMADDHFLINACLILDERDFQLPHYHFQISIGQYIQDLVWTSEETKNNKKYFTFTLSVKYQDILLTKKSTPLFIHWTDDQGYGFRTYLKYQYVQRDDSLANKKHRKLYYSSVRILQEYQSSIFLRETIGNNVYLCVRDINVTDTAQEQRKLKIAYWLSRFFWFHPARKSTLFFEKFASKYEESASVLFEEVIDQGYHNTYFIIDKESLHYQRIPEKYKKYIIKKYSFKHYFYFFISKMFVATESMNHIIELNIANSYAFLKSIRGYYDYIFLQHGVMYMYCLENRSDFIKGQGFSKNSKIVVSSQTEADHFIEYGQFDQQDLIISGLPKFDRSQKKADADKILIMPTSRDFEYNVIRLTPTESTYYKFVKNIIQAIPEELKSKIVVIGHPLLKNQLESTDLKEYMPENYVYNDLLENTKLLITDYSSISYDAFYRGSNVIFCWEDKEMCLQAMNYKLMLNDENVFADVSYHFDDLSQLILKNYNSTQTEEHIEKYREIVTYHDNRNTERCFQALKENGYYGKQKKVSIKKCHIMNFTKKVYSGERRRHTRLEIYYKKRMLVKDRDYKIYYLNNKRKTKMAVAIIVGCGRYYGIKVKRFRICESIMNYKVQGVEFKDHCINSDLISLCDNKSHYLRKDIDYTLTVEKDDELSIWKLVIKGKKLYAGKKELLFRDK